MHQKGDIKQYNDVPQIRGATVQNLVATGRLSARDMCAPHSVPKLGRRVD